MKIDFRDNNFIVFFNNKISDNINFIDKNELENFFKKIFEKIKDIYDISISGSYNIELFIDYDYGIIALIKKDDVEYFDYYDSQIDINITISKYDKFVYKLKGALDKRFGKYCDIYYYDNDFYVVPKRIDFISMGYLIENCEMIYGKKVSCIIKNGVKISNRFYVY